LLAEAISKSDVLDYYNFIATQQVLSIWEFSSPWAILLLVVFGRRTI
jgi:hypothetical protein